LLFPEALSFDSNLSMRFSRCWLLLPLVLTAAGIAFALWERPTFKGAISVEFDGWRMLTAPGEMVLIVHNNTDKPIAVTEVVCSGWVSNPIVATGASSRTQGLRNGSGWNFDQVAKFIRISSPNGNPLRSIAPGAKSEVQVKGFPSSGTAEVYFAPWTSEKAMVAATRAAKRPKWLARWLRPPEPTKVSVNVPLGQSLSF